MQLPTEQLKIEMPMKLNCASTQHHISWNSPCKLNSASVRQGRVVKHSLTVPSQLKRINAFCKSMSCQVELRTQDPNLQTESKFPVGDGIGSPDTVYQYHYKISGEKSALNQPGTGWVSWVPPCQWISYLTSEFLDLEETLSAASDLGTGLKNCTTFQPWLNLAPSVGILMEITFLWFKLKSNPLGGNTALGE